MPDPITELRRSTDREFHEMRAALQLHTSTLAAHISEDDRRWNKLLAAQEANTESIKQLTLATRGLVETWTALNVFQRFIKWVSSFAIIGGAVTWLVSKFSH